MHRNAENYIERKYQSMKFGMPLNPVWLGIFSVECRLWKRFKYVLLFCHIDQLHLYSNQKAIRIPRCTLICAYESRFSRAQEIGRCCTRNEIK